MAKQRAISKGIYRDRSSLRAIVNGASGRKEKRFPLETPLADIKVWRNETKVKLDANARRAPRRTDTLRTDAAIYLKRLTIASIGSRSSELDAWIALYGDRQRSSLTEADVRAAVAAWQVGQYAVRTCEHRVATLRHLFRTLDGREVITPCDGVKFTLPDTQPVYVPAETIKRVAGNLIHRDTQARFMVLTATGVRPSELMRAEPSDVSLKQRLWIVRTGKGGARPAIRLNDDMLAAWKMFIHAKAWGHYDTSTHAKRLYEAGWPKAVRPYQARATFGMELSRRGADLADIQQILGHRDVKTTRAYYVPREDSRISAAIETVSGRLGWGKLAGDVGSRKKARKSA